MTILLDPLSLSEYTEEEPCIILYRLYCEDCNEEFDAEIKAEGGHREAFSDMAYQVGWRVVIRDPGHDVVLCSDCISEQL